jgi:hypothetical protein
MKCEQDILNRIYKACFINPNVREKFFEDWGYVANLLENNEEEFISPGVLYCIDLWLDTEFNLTF